MTVSFAQVDWVELWRTGGLPSVIAILAVVGIIAGAKWFKSTMEGTLTDARKERDSARVTNEMQANRFLDSMSKRDEIMEKGFDEILNELRSNPNPRRK